MNPDFSDILSAFSAENVEFLVGAYALLERRQPDPYIIEEEGAIRQDSHALRSKDPSLPAGHQVDGAPHRYVNRRRPQGVRKLQQLGEPARDAWLPPGVAVRARLGKASRRY